MNSTPENQTKTDGCGSLPLAPGSALWSQFACAALVGEMTTISLHDQPHLWRPKQAEYAAELADAMMVEYRKRWEK
jgi:hypothetical protein